MIDHFTLPVHDYAKSKAFYEAVRAAGLHNHPND